MFPLYGILGVLIIIFAEFTMFLRIQPFVFCFTPMVWFGYILLVDAIIFLIKGSSNIMNNRLRLLQMFLVSVVFWYIFELYNAIGLKGWVYVNLPESKLVTFVMGSLSFSTIIPAVLETFELIKAFHLFNKIKIKAKISTNKLFINLLIVVGIVFLLTPLVIISPWVWAFVWIGFILLIDPILYIFHDEKSVIGLLKKKKFSVIFSIISAGYICGFLWEFWNYWSYTKWYYTIPILENIKIFEIPAVGFLAYGPFALEIYVMYSFIRLLLSRKISSFPISKF